MERSRRGGGEIVSSHVISGNRVVPNYKQFLWSTGNKASISAFINKYVEENAPSWLTNRMSIVLSGGYADGEIAKQITKRGSVLLNHLSCSQVETDTRMILHATDLCRESSRLIVHADDTDVLIVLLFYHAKGSLVPEGYMHVGHAGKNNTKGIYRYTVSLQSLMNYFACVSLQYMHWQDATVRVQSLNLENAQHTKHYQRTQTNWQPCLTSAKCLLLTQLKLHEDLYFWCMGRKEKGAKLWMT